jgi:two-component system sensor histidine kinase PilS (NtrC family)
MGTEIGLEVRLKRLMAFRLVMVTTLLLIAAYVEAVSEPEQLLPVNPLYFLIVATYGLTVLHALALRFLPALVPQVYAQLVGDLLVITGLVYVAGGVRTGFVLLYPISVLSGSVLVQRRGGLALAGLATVLYAATLWAVRAELLPASQGLSEVPLLPGKVILYSIFVLGVACATVALIGSYFSESLRHAGEKLEQAAVQVADLRELNELIVNSIHSGLLTTDASGHVLYVNDFGAAILGQPAAAVRGRNVRELLRSSLLEPRALEARARSRALERLEISFPRPEGERAELGVSVTSLAGARGGYLFVFQDLTDIKRLEEDVRTKEKLAAVGEMAAQLAHEIRNPLGSISGSAQVLMAEPKISAEQERLLAIITRESRRLSDTLNRFLFGARPSGRALEPVDVRPLLEEAVTLLRNGPEVGPDHSVELLADEGPHVCLADPDQIKQVFWNLARNGLEAMPEGGALRVRLRRDGEELLLSVRDQGRGMGRDEQRRIFEPFQSRTAMGTGLGLAIVYRIVREHRGDISVRSVPGQGTEVEVRLPLVAAPVPV